MTLDEFKDVYKDKSPVEKLRLMQVQHDYWRQDVKDRVDANWRGNFEDASYYARECDAMKDRVVWLMEEITKVLEQQEARLLKIEDFTPEKLKNPHHVYVEIRPGYYTGKLNEYYGGKPYPAVIMGWTGIRCDGRGIVCRVEIPGGYERWFNLFDDYHNAYNFTWRVWTQKPTEEQLEAEPWAK